MFFTNNINIRSHSKISIFLTVFPLFGWLSAGYAQNLDSLERMIQVQELHPAEQLRIYHDLSYGFAYTDFNKSVQYAKKGIALAGKENNLVMTGAFFQDLGTAYLMISQLDSASICLNKALDYAVKSKNEQLEATTNAALGNVYYQKGHYSNAMQNYMQALPILEKEKRKEQLGVLYSNIADLYQALHNHEQAIDFYHKSESVALELDDQSSLGCAWVGLSGVYLEKKEYDKALDYAKKALNAFHPLDDHINEVIALNAVAQSYFKGYKNYDLAEEYAGKALQISETSGFPASKAISLHLLSDIAFDQGDYQTSEDNALQALAADSSDINLNSELISNIALANIQMGNKDKAMEYFENYARIINARANKEFQSALSEMQVKYETEKKGIRIAALEKEKLLSDRLAILGGILLLAVLAIMSLRHRMIQNQKRLAEQRVLQQLQEQQLVAAKAVLEGETAGQSRLATALHDNLGTKLSVVKMILQRLKKNHIPEQEVAEEYDTALGLLDGTIKELSRTSLYIMPQSLTQFGLKDSLTDFCKTIPCAQFLFFGENTRIDNLLELTIYRTVYELVTAAVQHEGTTLVCVQLMLTDHHVALTVQENSRRFDTQDFETRIVTPIRNRIKKLNGTINAYYPEGNGTEIDIDFDLHEGLEYSHTYTNGLNGAKSTKNTVGDNVF